MPDKIIKILPQQEECKHEWENCICKRCGMHFLDKIPVEKYCEYHKECSEETSCALGIEICSNPKHNIEELKKRCTCNLSIKQPVKEVCPTCGSLSDQCKIEPARVELPEELSVTPAFHTGVVDKINQIIKYLRERE